MFGIYRTFLALAVAAHHLISIPVIGHYAVHGFFILSGYLMTYIMNNYYGYSYYGIKSFAVNRFLRLYPSYWTVLLVTFFIIIYWGEDKSKIYREFIYIPNSFIEWTQNITLIFANIFPSSEAPRLSPPTWALTIELLFYLLIAVGISKTKKLALIWLIISVMYMVFTHLVGLDYNYRYSIIFSGTLPFALGATVFHFQEQLCTALQPISKPLPIVLLLGGFLFNSFIGAIIKNYKFHESLFYASFYFNYLINTLLVVSLINGKLPFVNKKLDQKIGNFSYPIYLFHWQAGFLSAMIIWGRPIRGLNQEGVISFALAIAICFFVSWMIIRYVDKPLQMLRAKIKEKANNANSLGRQKASLRAAFWRL